MTFELKIPDSVPLHDTTQIEWEHFLQLLVNRRVVGGLRYPDPPRKSRRYMSRMRQELRAYARTGNFEHLLNIAVYTFLESVAPENKQFFFDNTVESATRDEFGA